MRRIFFTVRRGDPEDRENLNNSEFARERLFFAGNLWYNDNPMAKRWKSFRRAAMRLSAADELLRRIVIAMGIARMIL
jgi:hypothetical protein